MSDENRALRPAEFDPGLLFADTGTTCGALIAARDWSATPLGAFSSWPATIVTTTATILRCPVPMVLLWGEQGVLVYNDSYADMIGAQHPGHLGRRAEEAWPEFAGFVRQIRALVHDRQPLSYQNLEFQTSRRGAPEAAWFNVDCSPVTDATGRVLGALVILTDTTLTVKAKGNAGGKVPETALPADLDVVGKITGGFAHDFNNLLTPIMASLDILRRKVSDERSQRLISAGLQAAERAVTLIQRLLAFSGRQRLDPRAVSPAGLLEGMRDLVGSSAGDSIEMRYEVRADLPAIRVDPAQLEIAVLNLVSNARDALPRGGRITISAEVLDTEEEPVRGLKPGRYVSIAISDNGAGMEESTRARAIEPFFTTKPVGQGTGLGLSMVHGLLVQSGGAFHLISEPDQGTAAVMFLPVADQVATTAPGAPEAGVPARAIVLLVDDEDIVRMSIADGLRDLGYDVEDVGTAAEALEAVQMGFRPDVVITDHIMPGMLGADLAQALWEWLPDLPILMITGYAQLDPDATRGFEVMSKPFRQAELAARLTNLLARRNPKVVPFRPKSDP